MSDEKLSAMGRASRLVDQLNHAPARSISIATAALQAAADEARADEREKWESERTQILLAAVFFRSAALGGEKISPDHCEGCRHHFETLRIAHGDESDAD